MTFITILQVESLIPRRSNDAGVDEVRRGCETNCGWMYCLDCDSPFGGANCKLVRKNYDIKVELRE